MKVLDFYENTKDFEVKRCGSGDNDFIVLKKGIIRLDSPLVFNDYDPITMTFENYVFYDFNVVSWQEKGNEYHITYSDFEEK